MEFLKRHFDVGIHALARPPLHLGRDYAEWRERRFNYFQDALKGLRIIVKYPDGHQKSKAVKALSERGGEYRFTPANQDDEITVRVMSYDYYSSGLI